MENFEEEDKKVPPEPPVKEFHWWVPWKAKTCEIPSWWRELVAVLEVGDHKKLAWEVWASFCLPRRMSECIKWRTAARPPCTAMSSSEEVHATSQLHLCLQGYLGETMGEDGGISLSPPVLGGEN